MHAQQAWKKVQALKNLFPGLYSFLQATFHLGLTPIRAWHYKMLQGDEGKGTEHLTESNQHVPRSELACLVLYVQFISIAERPWFSKGQISCENIFCGMSLHTYPGLEIHLNQSCHKTHSLLFLLEMNS